MQSRWLGRIVFLASTVFLGGAQAAPACSVCFGGSSQDPANIGLRNGVIFLLAVVLLVLASFAKFFLNIRKRTKLMTDQF